MGLWNACKSVFGLLKVVTWVCASLYLPRLLWINQLFGSNPGGLDFIISSVKRAFGRV